MDWAVSQAQGTEAWEPVSPGVWEQDVARFFEGLAKLDRLLASDAPLGLPAERLYQGAIADALTHVGQLAMLRRLAGSLVRAENYSQADIVAGRVGENQSSPIQEFPPDFDTSGLLTPDDPKAS